MHERVSEGGCFDRAIANREPVVRGLGINEVVAIHAERLCECELYPIGRLDEIWVGAELVRPLEKVSDFGELSGVRRALRKLVRFLFQTS